MKQAAAVAALAVACTGGPALALDWPGRTEALATQLERAVDDQARAGIVPQVANLGPAAVPLLEALLEDPAAVVRAAACEAAGRIGAPELVPALIRRLADREPDVRAAAANGLGLLGDAAAHEALARAAADPAHEVRAAAVGAMAALGTPDAFASIVGTLSDRRREVVVAAIEALGALGRREAVYALLDRADDPSAEVSEAAVRALGELGAEEAFPTFVRLARRGPTPVALAAIDAAVALRAPNIAPALATEVLSPRSDETRRAAAAGLATLGDPSQAPRLAPLLRTSPSLVSEYFVALGPSAAPLLRAALREAHDDVVRAELLDIWLRAGDVDALDALGDAVAALDAEPDNVRIAFAASPNPEAVCRAMELVGDVPVGERDAWIAWAAERGALACVSPLLSSSEALPASTRSLVAASLLGDGDADAALGMLEPATLRWEDGRPVFASLAVVEPFPEHVALALLGSDDARVRREAALVIGERGQGGIDEAPSAEAVYALRPALARDDVRNAAAARWATADSAVARAAWGAVLARDCRPLAATTEEPGFAERRARSLWRQRCGDEVGALDAVDPVERVDALSEATSDALTPFLSASVAPDERAAALLRLWTLEPERAARLAADWRRDDALPVAVAASWVWARSLADEPERVERAVTHEPRSLAASALRAATSVAPSGSSEPVWVYAVDAAQGTPRADAIVVIVAPGAAPRTTRTGADGTCVVDAPVDAIVHVVGE